MQSLDLIVIVLFALIVAMAGMAFAKKGGGDTKNYFAAGGSVPWGINGLSLYMSFFSAGTFVVWGSIAYNSGLVAITVQTCMCIAGFGVAYFIAPRWRKTGVLTAAEYVRKRLGDKTQKLYTYIILVLSLGYTGAFLYPVAKIVSVSTLWPIEWCLIGLGLLILLYTVVGGLWAVIITDVLQFVILTAVVVIVVVLSLNMVGGFEGFMERAGDEMLSLTSGEYTWGFMAAFVIYNAVFIGGNWAYVQRYTSVASPEGAKKVGLTFGWLYLVSPLIWMIPPMVYKLVNPALNSLQAEDAYVLMCKEVLPTGLLGLMLGGMVFAAASSVNTTLNLAASVITNDIFQVLKPKAPKAQVMKIARMSTLFFGLATICVALLVPTMGGIVNVVLSIGAVTGCSLYGPPIWALFSKRLSGKAVLYITLLSLGINTGIKLLNPLPRAEEMLLGTLLPFTLLAVAELYKYARGMGDSADFTQFQTTHLEQISEAPMADDTQNKNNFSLKVLHYALLAVGLIIVFLGFNSDTSNILIAGMGLVIGLVGVIVHPRIKFTSR